MQSQVLFSTRSFNTQPRGGGCSLKRGRGRQGIVSTHSRAEAAAKIEEVGEWYLDVSTHSHPKVAAPEHLLILDRSSVSTHSRTKAAANLGLISALNKIMFQHTAARRRLPFLPPDTTRT